MDMQLEHVFTGDGIGRGKVQDERAGIEKRRGRRREMWAVQLTERRMSWLREGS
jgi:hypothetical protein